MIFWFSSQIQDTSLLDTEGGNTDGDLTRLERV